MLFKKVENCKDTYEIDSDMKYYEVFSRLDMMTLRLINIRNTVHNMKEELTVPNGYIIPLERIELTINRNAYIMRELATAWLQHALKYNEDHVAWYLKELAEYKDGELIQAV